MSDVEPIRCETCDGTGQIVRVGPYHEPPWSREQTEQECPDCHATPGFVTCADCGESPATEPTEYSPMCARCAFWARHACPECSGYGALDDGFSCGSCLGYGVRPCGCGAEPVSEDRYGDPVCESCEERPAAGESHTAGATAATQRTAG